MAINLPINKKWVQTNAGDTMHLSRYNPWYQGQNTLAATNNIDFQTNYGRTRTSKMLMTTTSATDSTIAGVPVGFKYFRYDSSTIQIFTVAGDYVYYNDGHTEDYFAQFTTATSYPTNCSSAYSDLAVYNDTLYVTTASQAIYYITELASAWSTFSLTSSDADNPHLMTSYAGRIYCTILGNQITSWTTAANTPSTSGSQYYITLLDSTFQIKWIKAGADKIWIGVGSVGNEAQERGFIYSWDGISSEATTVYRLNAFVPMSCVIKDDVPYVMDSNGRLLMYNGGTFTEIGRLPIADKMPYNTTAQANDQRYIHPNGMTLNNGRINVLVKNTFYEYGSPTPEFCPSGVWEYDDLIGLYHRYSPSYTTPGDSTSNMIDYSQFNVSGVGGLEVMKTYDNTSTSENGSFLAGITAYTSASTLGTQYGVFIDETASTSFQEGGNATATRKSGYIVTAKIDSQNVTDKWQNLYPKYKQLIDSGDRIVCKYRTTQAIPTILFATWTSGTTFTTTDTNMANYAVGDEIEVMAGINGGQLAHITAISDSSGTYTVMIDETAPSTSGYSNIRLQHWIKIGNDITDLVSQFQKFSINKDATWIQFKIWFNWTGNCELDSLVVSNEPSIKP